MSREITRAALDHVMQILQTEHNRPFRLPHEVEDDSVVDDFLFLLRHLTSGSISHHVDRIAVQEYLTEIDVVTCRT